MADAQPAFEVTEHEGVHLVRFTHETFNRIEVDEVSRQLRQLVNDLDTPKVIVDFGAVTVMSSRILGVIMGLHLRIRQRDGRLSTCGMDERIRHIFELMRLDLILPVCATVDEAQRQRLRQRDVMTVSAPARSP